MNTFMKGGLRQVALVAIAVILTTVSLGCQMDSGTGIGPSDNGVVATQEQKTLSSSPADRSPADIATLAPTPMSTSVSSNTPIPPSSPTAPPSPETKQTFFFEPYSPCGPFLGDLGRYLEHFVLWSPDDSSLVFGHDDNIWIVDAAGTQVNKILDANPGASSLGPNFFENGFHADLSPDGTLLAYSSCQFGTEYEFAVEGRLEQIGAEWYERGKFNYEIAVAQLDRSNQTRLTHNQTLDHFPVWSPDGARIAFVSNMTTHTGFRTG